METKLLNGDYVPDGLGGVARCQGADALLERVLFRLTARRGQFPPLPELGSRLYLLGRESAAQRPSAARQYAAEALAEEPVTVTDVLLAPAGEGRVRVTVLLDCQGTALSASMDI
ncbi:MAG: hypothetical protein HFF65_08035 [Oscillospiraceae bacterium]|jgi:phage gp46-like protein|nr:hypothetical protein [Oscillospiraceae bacterium]MCI9392335.1 hypothetical protein [Oscillospiraceae bacterium]